MTMVHSERDTVMAPLQMWFLHSDPTEAAKAITQRFKRTDLAPKNRPIREEFERTRARWPEVR